MHPVSYSSLSIQQATLANLHAPCNHRRIAQLSLLPPPPYYHTINIPTVEQLSDLDLGVSICRP
ncbi:hypothetical protein OG21DRAFT_1201876 [Imleria badia]|nr:hypothetical protein OG21DRAFT_1201876 [Imleria badia]